MDSYYDHDAADSAACWRESQARRIAEDAMQGSDRGIVAWREAGYATAMAAADAIVGTPPPGTCRRVRDRAVEIVADRLEDAT